MTRMDARTLKIMGADPAEFRARVVIDFNGRPTPLASVVEPWQTSDFQALDPALRRVVGQQVGDARLWHWLERPRGHSKTSDVALAVTWLLFASRRPVRGLCAAGDQDQAGFLREAILRLVQLNPWLGELLVVQRNKVINSHTGSECEFITSDAPSSYGAINISFIVADEISHWAKRELWDSLWSTTAKRDPCLLLAIMNAGFEGSWCWPVREAVRTDPEWHFSRLEGPMASWISPKMLAAQERLLPAIAYARLWLNQWATGSGDALSETDIIQAIKDEPIVMPRSDEVCVGGLDIGLKRDATGWVCVAKDRNGLNRVIAVRRWQAERGEVVDLADVERAILADSRLYRLRRVAADPNEAGYLIQRMSRQGVTMVERRQIGANLVSQAAALVTAFRDQRIEIPADPMLLRELRTARVAEKSYGVRLTAERTDAGHGDIVTALSIAIAEAQGLQPQAIHTSGWQPQRDILDGLRGEGISRSRPASGMRWGGGNRLGSRYF